tara:strand:- start:1099 stop:1350 length:252 start_codon:yes stop_codon:yes gene_type:complete
MKNVILTLAIIILLFLTMKDHVESFQSCDPEKVQDGDRGDAGLPGADMDLTVDNSKKEVINKFINDLRFIDGRFYLGDVLLGC